VLVYLEVYLETERRDLRPLWPFGRKPMVGCGARDLNQWDSEHRSYRWRAETRSKHDKTAVARTGGCATLPVVGGVSPAAGCAAAIELHRYVRSTLTPPRRSTRGTR
jgi:hypothetical protein